MEPIRPLQADWWRTAPISEPERPFRIVWTILGVTVLVVAIAGGGYIWFIKPWQVAAVPAVPPFNAAAQAAGAEASVVQPAPQLAVGLRPQTGQQQPDGAATSPVSAKSPPPVPDEPPKFASGLHPITAPAPPPMPEPAAEGAAPAEPPHALPQPRPVRKATPPSAAPSSSPSAPSSPIKF